MTAKIKSNLRRQTSAHRHKPRHVSAKAFERVYWPYLPLTLIIGLLLIMSGQSGALSAAMRHPTGSVLAYATSMSVSGLLSSTNTQRSNNSVAGLALNGKLNASAQAKANDMAARNYWSHNTPEGDPPWVFIEAQGYNYQKLGENLAAGFSSESATVNGWMASQPHKENLLDPAFTEVGFGFANNDNYTAAGGGPMTIVVAHYGRPSVLSSSTPPPAAPASQPPPASSSSPAAAESNAAPAAETPPAEATNPESDVATPSTALEEPFTTEGLSPGSELAATSSRIQSLLGALPAANWASSLAVFGLFAALGLWASRHALAIRRVFVMGESFAIRHPLVDISLITIAALSFLLTRTAGFIQ